MNAWKLSRCAVIAALVIGFVSAPLGADVQYRVTDLGTLGAFPSRAWGIDSQGRVVGEAKDGTTGRGSSNKTPVAVAVELRDDGKPGHVAMRSIERPDAHCLRKFAESKIEKGATLKTDGWGAYVSVARAGYRHKPIVTGDGKKAVQKFPWIHTFIENMKRMILGTYHSVSPKHLDRYLAEFDYRGNRRWLEENLFDRLIVAALGAKPITCRQLVTGGS